MGVRQLGAALWWAIGVRLFGDDDHGDDQEQLVTVVRMAAMVVITPDSEPAVLYTARVLEAHDPSGQCS